VYYAQRAAAGLIITEATEVSQQGTGCPNTPGIYTDEQVAAYAHLIVSTEDDMRHGGRSSTGR
jgi:N-ethylmaleimide reductase